MTDKFFNQNFDISEYIAKRTLEMKSLPERSIYKEIMQSMLVDLYEYHEKSYENLCNDIMNEVDPIISENPIYIGITSHSDYDATEEFLYPIDADDFYAQSFSSADIEEALRETGSFEIGKLYFDGNLQMLNHFKLSLGHHEGKIVTTKGEYFAKLCISFNEKYLNKVAEIYKAFQFNQKKWFPVCTAYLMRFFKIDVCEIDGKLEGEYQNFHISFLENSEYVKSDIFPLWNITNVSEPTSIYPKPIKESVIYEHKIFAHFLNKKSTYLLTRNNPDILQTRRNNGDLLIRTASGDIVEWELIDIKPFQNRNYKHILLSSAYAYKAIDVFLTIYKSSVKTKGELIRFLGNLPFSEYICFTNYAVIKETQEQFITYDMDDFEKEEFRLSYEKILVLSFAKAEKDHTFLSDFMSFYVTQIQKVFPEYQCVGRLK